MLFHLYFQMGDNSSGTHFTPLACSTPRKSREPFEYNLSEYNDIILHKIDDPIQYTHKIEVVSEHFQRKFKRVKITYPEPFVAVDEFFAYFNEKFDTIAKEIGYPLEFPIIQLNIVINLVKISAGGLEEKLPFYVSRKFSKFESNEKLIQMYKEEVHERLDQNETRGSGYLIKSISQTMIDLASNKRLVNKYKNVFGAYDHTQREIFTFPAWSEEL